MKHTRKMYFLPCVTRGFVAVGEMMGTPAFSAIGAPAMVLPLMEEPMIAMTFSFSTRRDTALAASILSLLSSARKSSTFLPRTVGFISLAAWIPCQDPCPYAAPPPVIG